MTSSKRIVVCSFAVLAIIAFGTGCHSCGQQAQLTADRKAVQAWKAHQFALEFAKIRERDVKANQEVIMISDRASGIK